MLLPAQMTQGGGICSDSQRITYTPAVGRERGDTGPYRLTPPAWTRWEEKRLPAPGKEGRTPQPRMQAGLCTSPRRKLGKLVINY